MDTGDAGWYDVPNTWSAVEIHYQAFAYSGSWSLWLDDVQKQSLTFIDNDTRTITDVRLGAQGVETGTRGAIYFDDFESRRFSYIGTLPDPGVNDPQATNQPGWFTRTNAYSTTIPHAVTDVTPETGSPDTYSYDANRNMTQRVEGGLTYNQTFDAENRLISVTVNSQTTQFIYDGNGNLVKKIKPDGSKTIYVGGLYEVDKNSGGSITKTTVYYPLAGAMRVNGTLYYVLKDHLGSASVVTDSAGNVVGDQRYYPFGATRLATGSMYTDQLFTGQREMAGLGIYHFGARFYSPYINRFLSADTVVPNPANPQDLNHYPRCHKFITRKILLEPLTARRSVGFAFAPSMALL